MKLTDKQEKEARRDFDIWLAPMYHRETTKFESIEIAYMAAWKHRQKEIDNLKEKYILPELYLKLQEENKKLRACVEFANHTIGFVPSGGDRQKFEVLYDKAINEPKQ